MKTKTLQTNSELALMNLKISPEQLNIILNLQKQVEEFKDKFIKQIDFYELPLFQFNGLSDVTIQVDGLKIEYYIEDNNIPETVFLPWEYFDNKNEYVRNLNVEEEKRRKKEAQIAAEARLKLAERELEEARKLGAAYKSVFGDVE